MSFGSLATANRRIWTVIGLTVGLLVAAVIVYILIKLVFWLVVIVAVAAVVVWLGRRFMRRRRLA